MVAVAQLNREELVSRTFVQLAEMLVTDFDVIDVLTLLTERCVELLDADAAGILLSDRDGNLRVVAASSEQARLLELFQVQNEEGPCLQAYTSGEAVIHADLRTASRRWPRFSAFATDAGFESVCALPLRLRHTVIGALNCFRATTGTMTPADVVLAQALADVASVAILHDQTAGQVDPRGGLLRRALDSRVTIEQATGMVAERAQVDMATAFVRMRLHGQAHRLSLTAVAVGVLAGTITLEVFVAVAVPDAEREDEAPTATPMVGGGERLLLVEDNELMRITTARLLAARGYDVVMAADGLEGLEAIQRGAGAIRLVVSDIDMPRMRGDEMGRRLAATHPMLPVVYTSGGAVVPGSLTGPLLAKPVSIGELIATIRGALDA